MCIIKKRYLFVYVLLLICNLVYGQNITNESYLMQRITTILALDENNQCMHNAIINKNENFKCYPLEKKGYYLDSVEFYKIVIDSVNSYNKCSGPLMRYCNQYIIAVFYNHIIFRLKGFNDNDFISFFLSLQGIPIRSKIEINYFIENYSVQELDFQCLYEASKEKSKFRKNPDLGKLQYKYPCLLPCKRPVVVR